MQATHRSVIVCITGTRLPMTPFLPSLAYGQDFPIPMYPDRGINSLVNGWDPYYLPFALLVVPLAFKMPWLNEDALADCLVVPRHPDSPRMARPDVDAYARAIEPDREIATWLWAMVNMRYPWRAWLDRGRTMRPWLRSGGIRVESDGTKQYGNGKNHVLHVHFLHSNIREKSRKTS